MMNVRDEQTALALRSHGMVGWLDSLSIMLSVWTRSEYSESEVKRSHLTVF